MSSSFPYYSYLLLALSFCLYLFTPRTLPVVQLDSAEFMELQPIFSSLSMRQMAPAAVSLWLAEAPVAHFSPFYLKAQLIFCFSFLKYFLSTLHSASFMGHLSLVHDVSLAFVYQVRQSSSGWRISWQSLLVPSHFHLWTLYSHSWIHMLLTLGSVYSFKSPWLSHSESCIFQERVHDFFFSLALPKLLIKPSPLSHATVARIGLVFLPFQSPHLISHVKGCICFISIWIRF